MDEFLKYIFSLTGKTAPRTGAFRGLGHPLVKACAAACSQFYALARSKLALPFAVHRYKGISLHADATWQD